MNYEHYIYQMQKVLELKGCTEGSKRVYRYTMLRFLTCLNKPAEKISTEDITSYLHQMILSGLDNKTVNNNHSIISFFFSHVIKKPEIVFSIPFMKKAKRLPDILTAAELESLFEASKNLKIKAVLMTAYSSGLRCSEVIRLKVGDIDSKKMQLHIRQAKGQKDRFTILSERNLHCLREYYRFYRPSDWMFYPWSDKTKHISNRMVQNYLKSTAAAAGISKKVVPHSLRHAFACHLLENGTDIYTIKTLLGHSSLRSTQAYLQLSPSYVFSTKSPLDQEAC